MPDLGMRFAPGYGSTIGAPRKTSGEEFARVEEKCFFKSKPPDFARTVAWLKRVWISVVMTFVTSPLRHNRDH